MKKEIIIETPKKFLYHKELGAKLFEVDENPEGWVDTPAKFEIIEPVGNEIIEDLKIKAKKPKK